mmetsp:Transcript_9924/g.15643  ORF Transcript_9924/g.15643 Transcript_9924/m.15643 type:complete len:208 (-) Transcript_9924:401-1024(-)
MLCCPFFYSVTTERRATRDVDVKPSLLVFPKRKEIPRTVPSSNRRPPPSTTNAAGARPALHSSALGVFVVDLGRQVVPHVAVALDGVLHHHGHVRAHAQGDRGAQRRGLGERIQVPQREGQLHGLLHVDRHVVLLLVRRGILLQRDAARAQVALHGKLHPVFVALDCTSLADHREISDDSLELCRGKRDCGLVVCVRNTQVLAVDVH